MYGYRGAQLFWKGIIMVMDQDRISDEDYTDRTDNEHEILRCIVGSQAYGTATPQSDVDYKGIYMSPKNQVVGINREQETRRFGPDDHNYSLRHFARLAVKCVPNVIELLWCGDEVVTLCTKEGQALRDNRSMFLSQRCIAPYIGYAQGQIHKAAIVPTNRGKGRQDIVAQHGYDTKFAMHTIRLLQTAEELLREGIVRVHRPNRDFLLGVREGRVFKNYDAFRKHAQDLIEQVRALEENCPLPKEPDMKAINDLLIAMQEQYWIEHPEM